MSHSPESRERSNNFSFDSRAQLASGGRSANDPTSGPASHGPPRDSLPRRAPALPPIASLSGGVGSSSQQLGSASPTPWRSLGVRNILNPTSDSQVAQTQPGAYSPQSDVKSGRYGPHAAPDASPHMRKRGEPHTSAVDSQTQQGIRPGRRVLTPRSPSLRAASIGVHRSPSAGAGLINRIPLPHGEGRIYTAEPGEGHDAAVPPLPPLPATSRSILSGVHASDSGPSTSRPPPGVSTPPTASSTRQHENQSEHSRPPYHAGEQSSSGFPQGPAQVSQPSVTAGGENQANYTGSASGPVRSGLPYGQSEYQLTFETQQGPMVVPVNVDYQQASRLADEKRKRNAGASARFRARRKEKEREANTTISGLQQELQDLMEEREFYMRERNFFRDLLARSNPGPLPARPHSPQALRSHATPSTAAETSPSVDFSRGEMDMQGSQRRRTGEYQPSLTSQSPSTPYNPPFPLPGPSMTLPAPSPASSYSDARAGPHSLPPTTSRPPPFDPLRRNPPPERDWYAGREGRE